MKKILILFCSIFITSCTSPYTIGGEWGYFSKNEKGEIEFVYTPKAKIVENSK